MRLTITDGYVLVEITGIWRFLALKSAIRIPLDCIRQISTEDAKWLIFTPKAGTSLPGLVMAGTFFRKSGMSFYFVKNPKKCISLTLENHRYRQVVLQVEGKEKVAKQIREKINQ